MYASLPLVSDQLAMLLTCGGGMRGGAPLLLPLPYHSSGGGNSAMLLLLRGTMYHVTHIYIFSGPDLLHHSGGPCDNLHNTNILSRSLYLTQDVTYIHTWVNTRPGLVSCGPVIVYMNVDRR